ncbi:PREDICTED: solute carrier family 25 member 43 [Nanorana parkeri]|uniref:solute carrier family 25 member 43 n=1 Tax=Nanorana parkeri TaxID=125878 RepID=UPI00085427B3|nr:PREDICTED: solute carrier family 25 member 43 [Nanorana parkeri]
MASLKRDPRLTSWQSTLCGGAAGVLSRTATAPLDVAKILTQVGTFHSKQGFFNTFRLVYTAEGLPAFWKGNLTACVRLFPYSAVQLSAYHKLSVLFMDDLGQISPSKAIVAGGVAGMLAAIVIYPTDVIKTRLIVQNSLEPTYRGIIHALCSVYYQEGFRSLYRGVSLSILGAVPFSAGLFFMDVSLDRIWQESGARLTPLQNFVNGCLAAAVAQTMSFPFETVKKKMQAQSQILPHCGSVDVHFNGVLDCFRQIVKMKGVLSLWNGLTANLLKIFPYYGLMFSTFECCKRYFLYRNGYLVSPLSNQLMPGVDQSLGPWELQELRKFLRQKNIENRNPSLKS